MPQHTGADYWDPLSSNDCIVSDFLQKLACDCALMAMNFRGRVEGCEDDDVGNYEDLLTYHPADYATPGLIRQSVTPTAAGFFTRAAQPRTAMLTSGEHFMGGTYGAVTNWATFSQPLGLSARIPSVHRV